MTHPPFSIVNGGCTTCMQPLPDAAPPPLLCLGPFPRARVYTLFIRRFFPQALHRVGYRAVWQAFAGVWLGRQTIHQLCTDGHLDLRRSCTGLWGRIFRYKWCVPKYHTPKGCSRRRATGVEGR